MAHVKWRLNELSSYLTEWILKTWSLPQLFILKDVMDMSVAFWTGSLQEVTRIWKCCHKQIEDKVLYWRYHKGLNTGSLRGGFQQQKRHGHRYCLVGVWRPALVLVSRKVNDCFTWASLFPFLGSSSLNGRPVKSQYWSGTCNSSIRKQSSDHFSLASHVWIRTWA